MHSSATTTASGSLPRLGLAGQPVYATLVQFPAVCFVGALLTDLVYWRTAIYIWENFSIWLLTIGCIMAGFTAVAALATWISHPHVRVQRFATLHVITILAALILSIVNAFVHSRDGYLAVVPQGLTLSIIVVILMLLATWLGWPRPLSVEAAPYPTTSGAL